MKSPFQYGTLFDRACFVNRVVERKQLKDMLGSGINVMLISPRRWGKSSLVKVAMDELAHENKRVRVCYMDAFSIHSEKEFYHAFARSVIACATSTMTSNATGTFSLDLKFDIADKDVMEILNLPERIAQTKGLQLIVCIDEFQQLAQLPEYSGMEGKMRSVWQHQQHVSYCFYGSKRHMMLHIFNNSANPFYRFGQVLFLQKIKKGRVGCIYSECLSPHR